MRFRFAWCFLLFAVLAVPALSNGAEGGGKTPSEFLPGEDFSIQKAMGTLFGNVSEDGTSRAKYNGALEYGDDFTGKDVILTAFAHKELVSNGEKFVYVVTSGVPAGEDFYCHVCRPVVGFHVFQQDERKWGLVYSNPWTCISGLYGKPSQVSFAKIGNVKNAICLHDSNYHMGIISSGIRMFEYVAGGFAFIFSSIIEDSDECCSECDKSEEGHECYSNVTNIYVGPMKGDHYVLKAVTTVSGDRGARVNGPVEGTTYYWFDEREKRYVQADDYHDSGGFELLGVSGKSPEEQVAVQ